MTDVEMASLTALQDWCRDICACYPDVEIQNMSASFRDGLAFCAIIHKHRPDLIDFSSLSRDKAYQNNQLAFETAEMKLGIPALLHPKELVSSEPPDSLGVLTYLSWYYCFFSRPCAGLASLGSSHVTGVKRLPRSKTPDGPKHDEDSTRQPSKLAATVRRSSNARVRAVCHLCLKPVHLIQRRLVGGKIYHRSCLRCRVCRCSLLPHCYTQMGDSGTLVCSHHPADGQVTEPEPSAPAGNRVRGSPQAALPFGGSGAVGSAARYTESTRSEDKLVSEAADMEGKDGEETSAEGADSPAGGQRTGGRGDPSGSGDPRAPAVADAALAEAESLGPAPEVTQWPQEQIENSARQCTCSGRTQGSSGSSSAAPRLNHPWLTIIHPGPWMHLPAAPPPAPPRLRHRPRVGAPNPFETVDENAKPHKAAANHSGKGADGGGASIQAAAAPEEAGRRRDETIAVEVHDAGAADARARVAPSEQPQLPRSPSVLAATSATCSVPPPERPQSACREAQCDHTPALTKSQTFQASASPRAPAPGHGFPLIRRKVQTDHNICPESLQVEVVDLDKRLEAMEWRGVELERNLRDCGNEEEEEEMLMEWFALNHERHVLVRRDMELGYLTMQQKLEERQADVEYELRRLFSKQENEWTEDEQGEERHLMDELLSVVEQRNQIICSLDQDVQRERKEDKLLKATLNSKDLQKEGLKELRKSKGKLNPSKVFKLLNHRAAASVKHPPDKRS